MARKMAISLRSFVMDRITMSAKKIIVIINTISTIMIKNFENICEISSIIRLLLLSAESKKRCSAVAQP